MHKVSAKRQVTLPKELCIKAGIEPGNDVEIFEYNGMLTVVKQVSGASKGCLAHLKADDSISEKASLESAIQ